MASASSTVGRRRPQAGTAALLLALAVGLGGAIAWCGGLDVERSAIKLGVPGARLYADVAHATRRVGSLRDMLPRSGRIPDEAVVAGGLMPSGALAGEGERRKAFSPWGTAYKAAVDGDFLYVTVEGVDGASCARLRQAKAFDGSPISIVHAECGPRGLLVLAGKLP